MYNLSEKEHYITTTLAPLLTSKGFHFEPARSAFVKPLPTFEQVIKISVNQSQKKHLATLSLQAGVNALIVEDIVRQFRNFSPIEGNFTAYYENEKSVKLNQLNESVYSISQTIEGKALPLLQKLSSLQQLDALFNRYTYSPNKAMNGLLNRCFKGLVLARFSHRRRFQDLYQQYLNRLNNHWAPRDTIRNFTKLYNFLRFYSLN